MQKKKAMKQLYTGAEKISLWLAWLAGAIIIFGCALPISVDVISRALIGSTLVESFEISGYALAACIGLGMAYTVTTKANIRVDILTAKLPRPLRRTIDLIASVALAVTAFAFAYYTFDVLRDSWQLDARSISTLQVPLVIPQGIWWAGFVWFAAMAVLTPLYAIGRLLGGDTDTYDSLISSSSLADELSQSGIESKGTER